MSTEQSLPSFESLCLHADGHNKPLKTHAPPIFQTSSFVFDSPEHGRQLFAGEVKGHIYSRIGNPTIEQFELIMTKLEKGKAAIAFSSGMAAVVGCTLSVLSCGDHVVVGDTLYGPSTLVLTERFKKFGIESTIADMAKIEDVKAAMKPNTKIIYCESPANPTCKITDIVAVSEIAHSAGAIVVVDSTFASPANMNPLLLGADVVLHSLTKYINGHGDVVGGVAVANSLELAGKIRSWRKDTGSILGPFDTWLVMRGIRTLAVRMHQHNINGMKVARFLHDHPEVRCVMYPGLEDHPGHEIAKKQMPGGYGSTLSFCMKRGFDAAKKLLENCHLCTVAVSLGNADTLIEHPASMTHASVPEELMLKQGLTRDLIRISVGLEDIDEIIADLKQAIEKSCA